MTAEERIAELEERKRVFWATAQVFLDNRDAHGLHDMGVEIQALDRAIIELKAVEIPGRSTSLRGNGGSVPIDAMGCDAGSAPEHLPSG